MATTSTKNVQAKKPNMSEEERNFLEIIALGQNCKTSFVFNPYLLLIEEIEFEDDSVEEINGVFIAQGIATSVDFAKKLGAMTENNFIVVNEKMETTVPNIYACGDCTGGLLQISKAVYEGTKAGIEIIKKMRVNMENEY